MFLKKKTENFSGKFSIKIFLCFCQYFPSGWGERGHILTSSNKGKGERERLCYIIVWGVPTKTRTSSICIKHKEHRVLCKEEESRTEEYVCLFFLLTQNTITANNILGKQVYSGLFPMDTHCSIECLWKRQVDLGGILPEYIPGKYMRLRASNMIAKF